MKWSEIEVNNLIELYRKNVRVKDIVKILGRSERAVSNKAHMIGIAKKQKFTDKEVEYIVENYGKINLREITENLGRPGLHSNICRKAKELGLTDKNRDKIRHKNTPEPAVSYRKVDGVLTRRKYDSETERRKANSDFMIQWHKENEHPRGMKGKTHSEEYKKKRSQLTTEMWEDPNNFLNSKEHKEKAAERMSKTMARILKDNPNIYTNAKGGTREDLGFYVRSRWEANVARYLKYLKEKGEVDHWEYENETFRFEDTTGGVRTYTPDFKVWIKGKEAPIFWEVKGFMDEKSKTRLNRMEKEYGDIEIKLIQEKEYRDISSYSDCIKNWEIDKYSKGTAKAKG